MYMILGFGRTNLEFESLVAFNTFEKLSEEEVGRVCVKIDFGISKNEMVGKLYGGAPGSEHPVRELSPCATLYFSLAGVWRTIRCTHVAVFECGSNNRRSPLQRNIMMLIEEGGKAK